jgi:ATP-dependent DNA helicase RecG
MGVMCDSIFKLIESGEGECVEFKTASKGVYDGTFETVCSFCNHLGGDILLGFNDYGNDISAPRKIQGDMIE